MMKNGTPSGAAAAMKRLTDRKTLSHAYILTGPAGSGKHALADWMAAYYVCSGEGQGPCGRCSGCRKAAAGIHPDIIRAGGSGEAVNTAAARMLRADAYIRPNEALRKVYLLEHAQDMNASAQNALLKVLEEGPPYAAFLLMTENDAALLPTIRSRCEIIRLAPAQEDSQSETAQQETAAQLAQLLLEGSELELLAFAVSLEKWDRESFAVLLEETGRLLRRRLAPDRGDTRRILNLIEHVRTLRRACEFHLGAGHLAGWLAARACGL